MIRARSIPGTEGWGSTQYVATRDELIAAGLAVPKMFPAPGRYTVSERVPGVDLGHWHLDNFEDELWALTFHHGDFVTNSGEAPPLPTR